MQYRTLGSTGLNVSVVGIGTWQFGGEWGKSFEQDEVDAMFARGHDLGLNLIDTAECYGDHLSESLIGRAIEGTRDRWVLATKVGHKFHAPFDRSEPRRPRDVIDSLVDSLKALKTDHVDLVQYHSWGDDQFFGEDVLAALLRAKEQGLFRFLGNSVGSNGNVKQVAASREMSIEVVQIIYNRLDRTPEDEVFGVCRDQNLGVLARVPLASGLLSGKYRPGQQFPEGDVRQRQKREVIDAKLAEAERIRAEEVPAGTDMSQWALAWCLKNPAVTAVIPGCKSVEQVEHNAAAAELVGTV